MLKLRYPPDDDKMKKSDYVKAVGKFVELQSTAQSIKDSGKKAGRPGSNGSDLEYRSQQLKQRYAGHKSLESENTEMDLVEPPIELTVDTFVKDAQWAQTQAEIKDWIRTETTAMRTFGGKEVEQAAYYR